jgi:hypothetical protein
MTQLPGAQPQRTLLSAEEKNRAEVNFVPYVARALASHGRYANGREIVITFGQQEAHGLTGQGPRSIQE